MEKRIFSFGLMTLASIAFLACSDNDESAAGTVDPAVQANRDVLTDLSTNVITNTYEDLNNKALALKTTVSTLTIGDEAVLAAVKEAWKATRSPWEQSEGFLYGPVDTGGIDPAMDTWPVDVNAMNDILAGTDPITTETVEANVEARGFHLIEFLIWGENGNKLASDLTAREIEYLNAAAADLQNNTQILFDGWVSTGGNYAANFITAGNNTIYPSQKVALEQIVDGMITIADEVANGKIQTPLDEGVTQEESRFSNNSKKDFADNMRSIQNIYSGDFNDVDSKGITDLVAAKNAGLDTEIKAKIDVAIQAIEAIPGTFTQALTANTAAVENAQQKVNELRIILESQLKPFINNN